MPLRHRARAVAHVPPRGGGSGLAPGRLFEACWLLPCAQVKKLIELAQRPVTIDFSTEEEVVFPPSAGGVRGRRGTAIRSAGDDLPAYALKPGK